MRAKTTVWLLIGCLVAGPSGAADEAWTWRTPGAATKRFVCDADWRGYDAIEVDVQALARRETAGPVALYFFLENKQSLFFQSQEGLVLDGTRQTLRIDLHEDRTALWCVNARRPLAPDALRWVRAWGVKAHAPNGSEGRVRIGAPRLIKARKDRLRLTDMQGPARPRLGAVNPVRFTVRGFRGNPFCTDEIQAFLDVEGPDGSRRIPAFFRQDFRKVVRPGTDRAEPIATGRPGWQANWRPEQPGEYRLSLAVTVGSTGLTHALGLVAVDESDAAADAPVHQDTAETADASRFVGAVPDRVFKRSEEQWLPAWTNGPPESFWQVRLDWTPAWGRYTGMGEFDQLAAWRFEAALDRHGTRTPRPILFFGEKEMGRHGTYNWLSHPFNRENAGHLQRADLLFADPVAARTIKNRARYLWARYGDHPAVSGLLVQASGEAPHVVAWVRRIATELQKDHPGMNLLSDNPGLPARVWRRPLDLAQSWTVDPRLAPEAAVSIDEATSRVQVRAEASRTAALVARSVFHWAGAAMLSFDILAPASAPEDLKVMAFFRTGPRQIFESDLRMLKREEWTRVGFRLDTADDWTCARDRTRHPHPYDWLNIREIGLRFFSVEDGTVAAAIGPGELSGPYRFETEARSPLAIRAAAVNAEKIPQYEKFEVDFHVNRVFNNPYDPREADATLTVTDPEGTMHSHPAFFYEPWRLDARDGRERAEPDGAPSWRARFAPWMTGRHAWRLTVRADDETAVAEGEFECVQGTTPGFVRVSKKDPRYFEFSGGDFYFPIGHNVRSPGDDRARKQGAAAAKNSRWAEAVGTGAYARWFERMRDNGENFARIWMAPWWGGLEWNRDHEGYHGLGYYNQGNAARLDRIVELAEANGIYLNMETLNHGALSTRVDADWEHNPMNRHTSPEGYLSYATEFFGNERAIREHRNRLRYIVARWGYSRSIAWWGLLTEAEWVEAYFRAIRGREKMPDVPWIPRPYPNSAYRQGVIDWLVDTARYVHETDAHPRPVSAHFSMPQHGTELWRHDGIDVVHNNAYTAWIQWWREGGFDKTDGVADVIHAFADRYHVHARSKPLMIGEWGGTPYGSDAAHLAAELHTGLWVMAMTRCAGVAGFWWWNFLDAENLYPRFKAVANFMANEDRRGKNYRWQRAALSFPDAAPREDFSERHGVVLFNEQELRAYLFSKAANRRNNSLAPRDAEDPRFPPTGEGWLDVPDTVGHGRYRVEYWDPQAGAILSETEVTLDAEKRRIPLPSHRVDLALKLNLALPKQDRE